MKKPKEKVMCHGCMNDFDREYLYRVLIDARSPHNIFECKGCLDKETRMISFEPFLTIK